MYDIEFLMLNMPEIWKQSICPKIVLKSYFLRHLADSQGTSYHNTEQHHLHIQAFPFFKVRVHVSII